MSFHTPHGLVRYRLPWSWAAFDYREFQPAHWGWTPEYGLFEVRARMDLSPPFDGIGVDEWTGR
jgi:hypothetical protein